MPEEIKKKRNRIFHKMKHKYRLIIYNEDSFQEVWHLRLSRLNVLAVFGSLAMFTIFMVTLFIAFTPLREFIPGYPDSEMNKNIKLNALKVDSLEHEMAIRDKYFKNINNIISGNIPKNNETPNDTAIVYHNISFDKSSRDSVLRQKIEEEEQYNFSVFDEKKSSETSFSSLIFFAPVKGIVTNSFDAVEDHFGTDIVASGNEVVKATLDGTVIMASWTLETGYVIQIQHINNLVSVYKHNADLLKKVGDHVKAGEAIAIIGNSGELTTGPHLHFELWHEGKALNPEEYIVF
jgi:murein DD-endopeptidase MepM/ murein hydrolase activator NlpD